MSDQEMQFADPEWQPPQPRRYTDQQAAYAPLDVNDAPRQRASRDAAEETSERDYARGYRAESAGYQYEKPPEMPDQQPHPRRHRPSLWIIAAIIIFIALVVTPVGEDVIIAFWRIVVLALIVGAAIAVFALIKRSRKNIASTETHTFSVGAHPKISIKDDVGSIRVHPGGEEYQVVVKAIKHKHILLGGDIKIDCDQNIGKNSIAVKSSGGWSFIGTKWVDYDITVPRIANLELKTDAGTITVDGIIGQVSCSTDAGTVKVADTHLRGNSKLKTDAGTITFSGSLDPSGNYQMTTDAGTVSVTLPRDASFRLDAKTDVGSITSDFPLLDMRRDFPGGKARCDVGLPPYPSLKLRTDVGSINIRHSQN